MFFLKIFSCLKQKKIFLKTTFYYIYFFPNAAIFNQHTLKGQLLKHSQLGTTKFQMIIKISVLFLQERKKNDYDFKS